MNSCPKKAPPLRHPSLELLLEAHLLAGFEEAARRSPFGGPTVGLEQEFFIFKRSDGKEDAEPASLEDSQRLLVRLSEMPRWRVFKTRDVPANGLIRRVSREISSNRYTVVKYECPPNLLEVAFTYFDSLADLNSEIEAVWGDLERAALDCGLDLRLAPFVAPLELNLAVQYEVAAMFPLLAKSRRHFYESRGEEVDPIAVDFPSYTAATQTQVGIPYWWRQPDFMHRLYALELALLPLISATPNALLRRIDLYEGVFRGLPLLGVPNLPGWSLHSWVNALCDSPLTTDEEQKEGFTSIRTRWNAGKTDQPEAFLPAARDLQFIRPKFFGAIEFRVDPSVSRQRDMIHVAALRFAASLLASDSGQVIPNENFSMAEIRSFWNERVKQPAWVQEQIREAHDLYARMQAVLRVRGKGEEIFLRGPHGDE